MTSFSKDPQAVLDYAVDWSKWLAVTDGEAISTSVFTVPSGIVKDLESNTTTKGVVWLSGGTVGTDYLVVHRITTNQGRTNDFSFTIKVREA